MVKRLGIALLLIATIGIPPHVACQTNQHEADLSWGASTTTGVTYAVLRGTVPGGAKITVQSGLTTLAFVDSGIAANSQFCYQVIAQKSGLVDSSPTNEVCGSTGKDSAGTPGTLVIIFN